MLHAARQLPSWLTYNVRQRMKLASCILAFSKGITASTRPEDRALASEYLAALAPLLAKVVKKEDVRADIESVDRFFGHTWIVDDAPFKEAFELWRESKSEIQNGPKA